MTPTEMELRVAKALWEYEGGYGVHDSGRCSVDDYILIARAAIQAMREPTQEMIESADKKSGVFAGGVYLSQASDYEQPHQMIWQAMINAASPTTDGDK